MRIDWPHMIVSAVLIAVVLLALRLSGIAQGGSRLRRVLVTGAVLFVVLFVFNMIWPYGAGAPDVAG